MWRASGRRDITDFEEVERLDTQYIDEWDIELDVKVLLLTVMMVLGRKG
jgi:lipopolysaccharide/colanic/teichoic acid biosynthesis glycosyltransferase